MTKQRDAYQKIIPCILAAMAVIFAIWTAVSRSHERVQFHGELLEISTGENSTVYSGELYGSPITITSREENGTKLVDFSAPGHYNAACWVKYLSGTIRTEFGTTVPRILIVRNDVAVFSGGYDPDGDAYMKYYNEDGTLELMISAYASSGNPWDKFEFTAGDIMRFSGEPATSARGSWGIYFLVLFCSLLVSLKICFRDEIFYFSHFHTVRDPEPTEYFYDSHKVGSVLGVILLLFFYIKGIRTIVLL